MFRRLLLEDIIKFIWQKKVPPRAEMIVWFLAMGRLKTMEYLHNWNYWWGECKLLCSLHQIDGNYILLKFHLWGELACVDGYISMVGEPYISTFGPIGSNSKLGILSTREFQKMPMEQCFLTLFGHYGSTEIWYVLRRRRYMYKLWYSQLNLGLHSGSYTTLLSFPMALFK